LFVVWVDELYFGYLDVVVDVGFVDVLFFMV